MGMLYHTSAVYSHYWYRLLRHLWQEKRKARCMDSGCMDTLSVCFKSPFHLPGQLRLFPTQNETNFNVSCNRPSSSLTAGNSYVGVDRKGQRREQMRPCSQLGLQTSCPESRGLQSCSHRYFPLRAKRLTMNLLEEQ